MDTEHNHPTRRKFSKLYERIKNSPTAEWENQLPEYDRIFSHWKPIAGESLRFLLGGENVRWAEYPGYFQDYLTAVVKETLKAYVAAALKYKVLRSNYQYFEYIELASLQNELHFWRRRVVETLARLILTQQGGIELPQRARIFASIAQIKRTQEVWGETFGCAIPNSSERIASLESELKKFQSSSFDSHFEASSSFKKLLATASKYATDDEGFILGSYFEWSVLSSHVHFDFSSSDEELVHFSIPFSQIVWMMFAFSRLAFRTATFLDVGEHETVQKVFELRKELLLPPDLFNFGTEFIEGDRVIVGLPGNEPAIGVIRQISMGPKGFRKACVELERDSTVIWAPLLSVRKI